MKRLLVSFGIVAACVVSFSGESLGDTSLEPCRVTPHLLVRRDGELFHPAVAEVHHFGAPVQLCIQIRNRAVQEQSIDADTAEVQLFAPRV